MAVVKLLQSSPTRIDVSGLEASALQQLQQQLTYHDKRVDHEVLRLQRNASYWQQQLGEEGFRQRLQELRASAKKTLLLQDEHGSYCYSGLAERLQNLLHETVEKAPACLQDKASPWEWAEEPPRLRPYQVEAVEALLRAGHGAVEIGTGLGKGFVALELARRRAQRTLLMAPSTNIAEQLYEIAARYLGPDRVGRYYDGYHEFEGLDVVVGNAQSLTRVKPDTEAWNWFAGVRTFIADESHLCPADTLAKVCLGLVANAPSRFFFSGTQLRADGLGLLLEAIIGSVVYSMTVQEGVDRGWLSRPTFFMLQTRSRSPYQSQDAQRMNRVHLLTNPDVIAVAADIANNSVACGSPVLILIDEFEQFRLLLPRLRHGPVAFAHGPLSRETKAEVPEPYRDSNAKALVDGFNGGRYPILIGTSAISTGTDVQAVKSLVYLRGGISEVEVRQAVGRGTRKTPVKDAFAFFDFRVGNVPMLDRHAKQRLRYYRSIYDNVRETVYG